MTRLLGRLALIGLPLMVGCASSAQAQPCPTTPDDVVAPAAPNASAASPAPSDVTTAPGAQANEDAPLSSPNATSADASQQPATPTSTTEAMSLPELKVKLSGMHIGGGPNDAETKKPFIDAIEAGFDAMRTCYRDADEPLKGGTYGVDLRVERTGGSPRVQSVRTAMKGDKMRSCLEQTFANLNFKKPAKGATVLSVSVRFTMEP